MCGANCKKSLEVALLSQGVIYVLAFVVDLLSFPVRHCVEKSVESKTNNVVKRAFKNDTGRRSVELNFSHTSSGRTMSGDGNTQNPMAESNPMRAAN